MPVCTYAKLPLGLVGHTTEQGFFPYPSLTISQAIPTSSPIGLPGINALFYCFCFETRTHVSLSALKVAMLLTVEILNFQSLLPEGWNYRHEGSTC